MASAGKPLSRHTRRYDTILRLVVALPAGYVVSALAGVCLSFWLPLSRADSAMAGILLGLLLWPVVFMMSFGITNIRRLAAMTGVLALVLGACVFGGGWHS
ncbi:hypothetical protein [Gluconobacter albidus]|uniref:Iron uptake protein n=1 Tax=Gluconobacter albidus TaxID=318683 RepID=A0AAW3QY88_9PROT|nr:hypothetical protein [Gluconobacter albidus]KXV38208.1 hypothetical protein AD941_07290 [Gluconobacter albidus]MBS1028932.1 hypothetical protein [Gluconobacter albidus]GBQ86729.1 hypothetical protein AA3250_1113 [Gluconobacter albidus NBRC 3250]GLQ69721.1 hypothetical protein GCM10007866_21740 [Gluconobacter albidus]